jgi:DNA primase
MQIPCLLAPARHKRGQDYNPSMSVSVGDDTSLVHCFSCGYSGTFEQTLIDAYNSRCYKTGSKALVASQKENANPFSKIGSQGRKPKNKALSDFTLDLTELQDNEWGQDGVDFLKTKGVDLKTALDFGVCYIPEGFEHDTFVKSDGQKRTIRGNALLIPTLVHHRSGDNNPTAVGAHLRYIDGDIKPKYFAIWPFPSSQVFFNEHNLGLFKDKTVFAVEGAFDCMHLHQIGIPSVCLHGVHIKESRVEKLRKAGVKRILLMLDPDEAGQAGSERAAEILKEAGLPFRISKPEKDPKYLTRQQLISTAKELWT